MPMLGLWMVWLRVLPPPPLCPVPKTAKPNLTVEVTPNDGTSDGHPGSADRTIDNATPAVKDVSIDPTPPMPKTFCCVPGPSPTPIPMA